MKPQLGEGFKASNDPQFAEKLEWITMKPFLRELTQKRLLRQEFRDVKESITAIGRYIDQHSLKPNPFTGAEKAARK
jgi:hypothetical protein